MEVTWSPDLETGIGILDGQHKELFVRIESFFTALDNKDTEIVLKTVDYLAEYTIEHFSAEEGFMIKHSYADFEAHRDEHSRFIKTVYQVKKKLAADGISDELLEGLKKDILDWIINHIQVRDKQLSAIHAETARLKW